MLKKIIFLSAFFIILSKNAEALNPISEYYLNHGVTACNGESPNCNNFMRKATELNDWREPISPEIRFD